MKSRVPPLLRRAASDEYTPMPWSDRDARALARLARDLPARARAVGMSADEYRFDRRGTAATLRAINREHANDELGGGYFDVPEAATFDAAAAEVAFGGTAPVVDVQTHLVDPARWSGAHAAALAGFLEMVDPRRWPNGVDPRLIDAGAWAGLVFGASETAVALLTSTPGTMDSNVLTNPQIASAREVVDRYAGSGRVLTHAIVHPNLGAPELDAMVEWSDACRPSGWKCYTLWGPPTKASPSGGWFLDDEEVGFPFLERVRALGPRVVAAHKGLGGPVPDASVAAASPRDVGGAAAAFGDIDFVVYHSGYERNPDGQEGPFVAGAEQSGVDRLIASLAEHDIGPGGNVYAELGTTWFLMLRRPLEAAHVLGKLLRALGPERILWGTDSVWYGSPQPLIDAFRAFRIPQWMQEQFAYPPLDAATKELILSTNARRVYAIPDPVIDAVARERDGVWVANALPALRRALSGTSG
jgi:predicted TIM-barrel fold metal-dependent hydrolase